MQLITGGMGFIGLHAARAFLDAGEEVVLTQYRNAREPAFLKGEFGKRVHVEQVDLTSAHAVIDVVRKYDLNGIVHLAAPPVVGGTVPMLEAVRGSTKDGGCTSRPKPDEVGDKFRQFGDDLWRPSGRPVHRRHAAADEFRQFDTGVQKEFRDPRRPLRRPNRPGYCVPASQRCLGNGLSEHG